MDGQTYLSSLPAKNILGTQLSFTNAHTHSHTYVHVLCNVTEFGIEYVPGEKAVTILVEAHSKQGGNMYNWGEPE